MFSNDSVWMRSSIHSVSVRRSLQKTVDWMLIRSVKKSSRPISASPAWTGSCVIIPREGVSRIVSLVPPVHIAVVEKGQVLDNMDELFALRRNDFNHGNLDSYLNIISGPSRSADIEYTLITGVHGPGEVHMVLLG